MKLIHEQPIKISYYVFVNYIGMSIAFLFSCVSRTYLLRIDVKLSSTYPGKKLS